MPKAAQASEPGGAGPVLPRPARPEPAAEPAEDEEKPSASEKRRVWGVWRCARGAFFGLFCPPGFGSWAR